MVCGQRLPMHVNITLGTRWLSKMSALESTGTSNETLKKGKNRKKLLEELFCSSLEI